MKLCSFRRIGRMLCGHTVLNVLILLITFSPVIKFSNYIVILIFWEVVLFLLSDDLKSPE